MGGKFERRVKRECDGGRETREKKREWG